MGWETPFPLVAAFLAWVAGLIGVMVGGTQQLAVGTASTGDASVLRPKIKEG